MSTIRREFEPVGPTMLKNPLITEWYLLPTLRWMGSWLPTYLPNQFFSSSREKISQLESIRQPLHSKMGTSPSSLESSWTWKNLQIYRNNRFSFHFVFSHVIPLSRLHSALTSCNFCVSTPILKLEMTLFMICIANQIRQVSVQLNSRVRPWTSKCPTSSLWIDDLKALYDHESILT